MRALITLLLALSAAPALAQAPLSDTPPTPLPSASNPPPQAACPIVGQTAMLSVRFYFGQSTISGDVVSHRAWQRFVAEQITAGFPDGFTIYDANGQFRDKPTGAVRREATEVVEIVAPDTLAFRGKIAALADLYRRQFNQTSVGIVTEPVCAMF